jgi:formate-dependent nitrite reductase cytochrome c552 subunit
LPMKHDAMDKQLTCIACHGAHDFNTRKAAVESCLTCHNDQHSLSYQKSPHFKLWHAELEGKGLPNSGVSCATCHMPREIHKEQGFDRVLVIHNQNANLRPNEKMIRSVCMNCHGLGFSIDALADTKLIERNFDGMPDKHIQSLDMAEAHAKTAAKKKREGSL